MRKEENIRERKKNGKKGLKKKHMTEITTVSLQIVLAAMDFNTTACANSLKKILKNSNHVSFLD